MTESIFRRKETPESLRGMLREADPHLRDYLAATIAALGEGIRLKRPGVAQKAMTDLQNLVRLIFEVELELKAEREKKR